MLKNDNNSEQRTNNELLLLLAPLLAATIVLPPLPFSRRDVTDIVIACLRRLSSSHVSIGFIAVVAEGSLEERSS